MKNISQSINEQNKMELYKKFEHLNSMCSYLAMFPSSVPEHFISEYTKEGDIVFDPFSGRGTTALQAIKLGRRSVSNDLSPLAYILTKAKTNKVTIESAINRVRKLEEKYNSLINDIDLNDSMYDGIKVFYSKNNLKQLTFLRNELGKKHRKLSKVDTYILAIALGIAHGKVRKTGDKNNSLYFSVSMPNGMSMAPGYAEKYIKNNKLHKIETNIFEQIIKRIETKDASIIENDKHHDAYLGDALETSKHFVKEKPKLIFTSPPYLNLIKYVDQNWIRFWILGFDWRDEKKKKMVNDYYALEDYKIFIKEFMLEMYKIMNNNTIFMMVIGDVGKHLIGNIMNDIFMDERINFRFKKYNKKDFINNNPIRQELKNKQTRQMGNRVGNATKNDWLFAFEKR